MGELNEYKDIVEEIVHRQNDCWYDTKVLANAVYAILRYLTRDRKTEPQYDFGEYADRLWKIAYERGKREALEQTEPQTEMPEYAEWKSAYEKMTAAAGNNHGIAGDGHNNL